MAVEEVAVVVNIAGTSIVEVEVLEVQSNITVEAGVSFMVVAVAVVSVLNEL